MARDLGDFQTPPDLCDQVLQLLSARNYTRVLEPTCGAGSFLRAALMRWPSAEAIGIEIQESYLPEARETGATIQQRNLFDVNLASDLPWRSDGDLLVIGNPPWVTNSELGSLGSINLPEKSNLKNLKGLDALTGSSNFDIAEYMILKLIVELLPQKPTVAMLCKTQVARNIFEYCCQHELAVSDFEIFPINAKQWFNAAVDACLFTFSVGQQPNTTCQTHDSLVRSERPNRLGFRGEQLVTDLDGYDSVSELDGQCQLTWRQGLKHDASSVMELDLDIDSGKVTSRGGEILDLESGYVFPLLKCTALHRERLQPTKAVIVPQRKLGEPTAELETGAPKLWSYLTAHGEALDRRRSSIYKGKPRFSVFGLGEYSFSPWKVAVSGLHNEPQFRFIGPSHGQPVFFDDTCYLLPFHNETQAALVHALLSSEPVTRLLNSLKYPGAKRPITKKLLQRVDFLASLEVIDPDELAAQARLHLTDPSQLTGTAVSELRDGLFNAGASDDTKQLVPVS